MKLTSLFSALLAFSMLVPCANDAHAKQGHHQQNKHGNKGGNKHSNKGGNKHSNKGGNHGGNRGGNQGGNRGGNQGGTIWESVQNNPGNTSNQGGSQSNQQQGGGSSPMSGNTNKQAIKITYTGTHVGQELQNGKIVENPSLPVGRIACGNASDLPNSINEYTPKSDKYTIFEIPSDSKTVTIPAGSVAVSNGSYYKLDSSGKFIRASGGYEEESGPMFRCNYGIIGQGGHLIDASETLKSVKLNDLDDNNRNMTTPHSFAY